MHTHSEHSLDSRTPLAAQAEAVRAAGIDVICVTDHNTIEGALRLREMAEGFRVVVGEEITSRDGEIIGLFLERAIPRGLSGDETIARIREQSGVVSIPHPFSHNRQYRLRREALDRMWPQVDAIEVFNAREAFAGDNRRAAAYARERNILAAAGSDAHRASEVGTAYVEMDDFADAAGFLDSLRGGTIHGSLAGWGVHVVTRFDRLRTWLAGRLR